MVANALPLDTSTSNILGLEVGETIHYCGQPHKVGEINAGQIQITHLNTRVMQIMKRDEFEDEYLNGHITFPERSGAGARVTAVNDNSQYALELAPDADMSKALIIKEYVEAIRAEYPDRVPNKEIIRISHEVAERIADTAPLGKDQIRKYLKRWDKSGGDIRSLLSRKHRRGNRKSRMPGDVETMIYDAIAQVFNRPEQPTSSAVYNRLCSIVEESNEKSLPQDRIQSPSKRTLMKAIRKRMGPQSAALRKGKKAANRQYRPVYQRPRATRPLERVQIDTKTLDVFVLENGKPKRPYLTAMLDEFSGCIVGYYIGLEPPCADNVLKCLYNAITGKNSN